jgi:NAD(P)-dependent dehydrogenase (short-subunit alcohol dehydrogenase family)
MALIEAFLPLLEEGENKRLFYVSSAEATINENRRTDRYGYAMAKSALHQFLQMIKNRLYENGYTFRVFDPMEGKVAPEAAAESAFNYIIRRRGTENHDPRRDDEDNLVLRDAEGRLHGW